MRLAVASWARAQARKALKRAKVLRQKAAAFAFVSLCGVVRSVQAAKLQKQDFTFSSLRS